MINSANNMKHVQLYRFPSVFLIQVMQKGKRFSIHLAIRSYCPSFRHYSIHHSFPTQLVRKNIGHSSKCFGKNYVLLIMNTYTDDGNVVITAFLSQKQQIGCGLQIKLRTISPTISLSARDTALVCCLPHTHRQSASPSPSHTSFSNDALFDNHHKNHNEHQYEKILPIKSGFESPDPKMHAVMKISARCIAINYKL